MVTRPKNVPEIRDLPMPKGVDKDRLDRAMTDLGLDVAVALGPENFHYLSGVWLPMARGYLDRQNIAVWRRGKTPILITGVDWELPIRKGAPHAEVRTYDEAGAPPPAVIVDTLVDVLKEHNLHKGKVGVEGLRTPIAFAERLRALAPDIQLVHCDELFRECRRIKSLEEVTAMRTLAFHTDVGIRRALSRGSVGMTERDLAALLAEEIMREGASAITSILLGSGERAAGLTAPSEKVIAEGEVIRIDLNSIWMGWYCDIGRMACAGEPSAAIRKDYKDHVDFKQTIFEQMVPGTLCSDVYELYEKEASKRGLRLFRYPYIGLGHSTGVNNDEFPKLNRGYDTPLETNMVMNVEPDTLGYDGTVYHVEDMVRITDGQPEVITWSRDWSSDDIPIIGT